MKIQKIQKEERLRNKRSQTSVIVVILLILLAIAGIVVLSAWVIPLVKNNLEAGNLKSDISIGSASFSEGNNDCGGLYGDQCVRVPRTYVYVERASSSSSSTTPLQAIEFAFQIGSKTLVYYNRNIPGSSESRTYAFALYGNNKPDSVKIVPVVLVNGKEKLLDASEAVPLVTDNSIIPRANLQSCSILLTQEYSDLPTDPSCIRSE
jgi:hypothetical protein